MNTKPNYNPEKFARIHGMENPRFYNIWKEMRRRCLSVKASNYHRYGGRGISIDKNWVGFLEFKKDMYTDYLKHVEDFGEKNTTLDRIDNQKDYCKENCRWSTWEEQENNRTNNRLFDCNGELLNAKQISKIYGISSAIIYTRFNKGWDFYKVITTPIKKYSKTKVKECK